MKNRLIHYSKEPLMRVVSAAPNDRMIGYRYGKPPGLWVSVEGEDDWLSWCQSEGFALNSFASATEIILAADARIYHLSTAGQIDTFTEQYWRDTDPEWKSGIDWTAVRAKWQGLIIAPYCWSRRLSDHTSWYYGWDCASGVIWDASAIKELKPIEPPSLRDAEKEIAA